MGVGDRSLLGHLAVSLPRLPHAVGQAADFSARLRHLLRPKHRGVSRRASRAKRGLLLRHLLRVEGRAAAPASLRGEVGALLRRELLPAHHLHFGHAGRFALRRGERHLIRLRLPRAVALRALAVAVGERVVDRKFTRVHKRAIRGVVDRLPAVVDRAGVAGLVVSAPAAADPIAHLALEPVARVRAAGRPQWVTTAEHVARRTARTHAEKSHGFSLRSD